MSSHPAFISPTLPPATTASCGKSSCIYALNACVIPVCGVIRLKNLFQMCQTLILTMSNLDPHLDPPGTLITQPNGSPDHLLPRPTTSSLAQPRPPSPNHVLPRPTTFSLSWPTYASKIAPAKLPQSLLVMPGKTVVLLSDLTSDPVYPAALFHHVFTIRRGVSHA